MGATFYRGYVVVDVPVAGQRQQMWVYRDGEFTGAKPGGIMRSGRDAVGTAIS